MQRRALRYLLGFLVIALFAACHEGAPPQQATGPAPEPDPVAVTKAEPPPYCRPMGMVKGKPDNWYLELRQQAADQGANVVVLDAAETTNRGFWGRLGTEIVGRAFFCPPPRYPPPGYPPQQAGYPAPATPPSAPAAPAAPPPATSAAPSAGPPAACQPPCSPGYDCQQGKCVPLCNPKCGPGQYCAADRTCRAAR